MPATAFAASSLSPTTPRQDLAAPPFDWLAPSGGISLGVGAALMLSGALVFGVEDWSGDCVAGSCTEPDFGSIHRGAGAFGAGAGFALVGGISLLGGLLDPPGPGEVRRSQPMMVAGLALTSLSAAAMGVTIAQGSIQGTLMKGHPAAENRYSSEPFWFMLGSFVTSGVGLPLMLAGADVDSREEERLDREEARTDARLEALGGDGGNVGMVVAGGILTGLGGLCGLAAPVMLGAGDELAILGGLPALGATALFLGLGIPLIYGGLPDEPPQGSVSTAVPEIAIGPGGITSRWRF